MSEACADRVHAAHALGARATQAGAQSTEVRGMPMSEDCLTLTSYFGERDRTARGLLADELMDLFGRQRPQVSVLLRGTEGFGRLHHLHTDRSLTLSEDLPIIALAVDRRERIEALLEPLLQLKRRGLLTLERTRILQGETAPLQQLPRELSEAAKLTAYVGRRDRVARRPAYVAVTELLQQRGLAGATVLLGVDGTRAGERMRARFLAGNADVPMLIVAVGTGERIADVLPDLSALLSEPLLTLERVRVCKRDGQLLARPHELPGRDEHGLELWQKLTVYTSQAATFQGHPLSLQLVRRLRAADGAGATSVRGIWGFHGEHAPHGDRFLQVRRHVPVVTIAIDTPERIARAFALVDELTAEHGLVTSEMVPALSAISAHAQLGGTRLARRDY
jgi:PII-like signaling protein